MKYLAKFLLILLPVTSSLFSTDWPTFRGNLQRTGYFPEISGCPKNKPAWITSLGCQIVSSPSVVGNTVYIGARDKCVYALERSTGKIKWKRETGGWVDSSPLIYKGKVFVGSRDGMVYILDKETGEDLSYFNGGLQLSSPGVLPNGTIVSGVGPPLRGISGYRSKLTTISKIDPKWSVPFPQMSYSSPSIYGQMAIIGASDSKLYGIDTHAEKIMWSLETGGGVYLSTPAIDETTVYFAPGNYDRMIYAVNLMDGSLIWRSAGNEPYSFSKTRNREVIHPTQFIQLLRLSPKHRRQAIERLKSQGIQVPEVLEKNSKRRKNIPASPNDFYPYGGMKTSSVAVGPKNVYVIQKELGYPKPRFSLLALDKKTGDQAWRFSELRNSIKLGYCSSPVVTKHFVYFGWGEGVLYALDADKGDAPWSDTLIGDIISSPAVSGLNLFVATMGGYVYCYELTETPPGIDFKRSTYCYPNPARGGVSHIQVYVNQQADMTMVIYNVAEKPVFRVKDRLRAGEKSPYDWNLRNVANGVYFALIEVKYDNGKKDKKILKIAVLH